MNRKSVLVNMSNDVIPTLYDWLGGIEALNRLSKRF
jgi:hypothetical protein